MLNPTLPAVTHYGETFPANPNGDHSVGGSPVRRDLVEPESWFDHESEVDLNELAGESHRVDATTSAESVALAGSLLKERALKGRGSLTNRIQRFQEYTVHRFPESSSSKIPSVEGVAREKGGHNIDQVFGAENLIAESTSLENNGLENNGLENNGLENNGLENSPLEENGLENSISKSLVTQIIEDRGKTIISTNQSPDIPFDQSINPYRGCEHGCIYCYARPSHAYWDLSPGLDFETKIITKPNADVLLRKTLAKPNYVCKTISIGANTDPYQPLEARLKTTRSILEVLQSHRHPFSLITKSRLVLRDIDLLSEMAVSNLCSVAVSVTTLNNDLKRRLEPRTASGEARLKTIEQLANRGIPVTMMVAPVIPFINDHEIETILEKGARAGASRANMIFLRLPHEVSELFQEWLLAHYPDKAKHVMSLVRASRAGVDYQSRYHTRMSGEGEYANMLKQRFSIAARKNGLREGERSRLDCSQFTRGFDQLDLF